MFSADYTPRISIVSGIVSRGDGLSETVIADLQALDRISARHRRNLDVQIFCGSSNFADSRVVVANDWRDIARDAFFQTSDICIFHFGIFNDVHQLIPLARRDAILSISFHNVTPPQYCPPGAEELLHISHQQIQNFRAADIIFAASGFSARQLQSYDLGCPVDVVPLFGPNIGSAPAVAPADSDDAGLDLFYCGRFAPSKGLHILMDALMEPARGNQPIRLTLAGKRDFSDLAYLAEIEGRAKFLPEHVTVDFAFDQSVEQIQAAIASADVLLLPSFHEGFGMPVAEALAAGTPVISSNAGSLPEVGGGLSLTCAPGDAQALGRCLDMFASQRAQGLIACDQGALPEEEWRALAMEHAAQFTREAYITRISDKFETLIAASRPTSAQYRAQLSSIGSDLVGALERPDRIDTAVLSGMLLRKAERAAKSGIRPTIRQLLKWPFSHEQSEADIDFWEQHYDQGGLTGLVRKVASIAEVRQSPVRNQASVTITAALEDSALATEFARQKQRLKDNIAAFEQDLEMLLSQGLDHVSFVKEAFELALGRPADAEGLASASRALHAGTMRQLDFVWLIRNSEEGLLYFESRFGVPPTAG